jgi:hypothetical protein
MTDLDKWINDNCKKNKDNTYIYNGRNYLKYDLHDVFINLQKL